MTKSESKFNLKTSIFSVISQDALVTVLAFVGSIITARWLGPVQLGLLYTVNLIPMYAEKFGRLGQIETAAIYYLGQRRYKLGETTGNLFLISLSYSILPFIFLFLFQDFFIARFLKGADFPHWYIWVAVFSVPFNYLVINANKLLLSERKVFTYNLVQIIRVSIYIFGALFFWWRKWDFFGVIVTTTATMVFLSGWTHSKLNQIDPIKLRPQKKLLKDLLSYGWKIYVISVVNFLHNRADLVLVAFFLDAKHVSFYGMAVGLTQILWKLSDSVTIIMFPELSKRKHHESGALTAKAIRNTFVAILFLATGLALGIYPLIRIFYGSEFLPLITPFMVLLPGAVATALYRVLASFFFGQGRPRVIGLNAIPWAIINVSLCWWVAPRFGLAGVGLVSTITYTGNFLVLLAAFKRISGLPYSKILILNREDIAVYVNSFKYRYERFKSKWSGNPENKS